MQVKRRFKQSLILLAVTAVLVVTAYGSHWATVAYADAKDKETISSLREQVENNATNKAKQIAKVSTTLQYLNENRIEFTTEAKGDTLVINIVGDRATHLIKDGEDTFVLSDTTHDPLIKER